VELFLQQLFNGLALGSTYALFAMGFGLIFAVLGVLNVAHGTFATWGALFALFAVMSLGVPFLVAAVVGVVAAGLLGIAVDRIAFEPLRKRGGGLLGPIITSIGFWIILGELAQLATGARAYRFPAGSFPDQLVVAGPIRFQIVQVVNVVLAIVVAAALHSFLRRSRYGSAIRAVGYDDGAAALGGVNPKRAVLITSFLAAGIGGLAGIMSGLATNNISFMMGENLLLKGFAAVVVGGFGDVRGAWAGGLVIGVSEVLGAQFISSSFRDAITFGLLLLFLVLRPQGLFGEIAFKRA
jgi:branched-chain amino acid transport system permease protein